MAHAGTPTDLAKQPATSTSIWQPLFSAVVILAIAVALATAALFLSRASTAPAIDRGYDAIEAQRGAAALSGATVDTSSAAIQAAAAAKARAMSGVAVDPAYGMDLTPRGAHGQLP
jgi:flagellar basal body-associated protein FliL